MSGYLAKPEEFNKSLSGFSPFAFWELLAAKLLHYRGTILILGGPDSGKTTLARAVLQLGQARGLRTGLLELDMGQSEFGPPTSCSLHLPFLPDFDLHYFVGTLSPAGSIRKCITACVSLFRQAEKRGVELLIVDPTGLIEGKLGVWLKRVKIGLLSPCLVVGLEENGELAPIFYPFRFRSDIEILSYKPAKEARPYSKEERAELRRKKFSSYFSQLQKHNLATDSFLFIPQRRSFSSEEDGQRGRVLGLLNDEGWLECLAILWEAKLDGEITIQAPPLDIKRVRAVESSSVLLEHPESLIIESGR